ncbi:MAG: Ribosomal small subunit methyltransferase [Verrucomicrobiota bacterium]|jgi:16S rRNA (guanine966-N2)-methyltransferase
MRIISGSARGTELVLPKTDLRPTMDLVRGAIFSSLGDWVAGARVLDLFSGTGSLGIEALSRGAASAILVESNRKACEAITQNLRKTRLQATVVQSDVFAYLKTRAQPAQANLIFADPPYSKERESRDYAAELLAFQGLQTVLAPEGLLVLEVVCGWKLPETSPWECLRQKRYGSTETLLLRARPPQD